MNNNEALRSHNGNSRTKRKLNQVDDNVKESDIAITIPIARSCDDALNHQKSKEEGFEQPVEIRSHKRLVIDIESQYHIQNPIKETEKTYEERIISQLSSFNVLGNLCNQEQMKYEDNNIKYDSLKSEQTYVEIKKKEELKEYESINCGIRRKEKLSGQLKKILYVINDIKEKKDEIMLNLKSMETDEESYGILRDFWMETILNINDKVHIMTDKIEYDDNKKKIMIIDIKEGLLVLYPDSLISGSQILDGIMCIRKVIINQYISENEKMNESVMYGRLIHKLFQNIIKKYVPYENKKEIDINYVIGNLIKDAGMELFCQGKTEEDAEGFLKGTLGHIKDWLMKYASEVERNVDKIERVRDIEECMWSPKYGLKGYIDASLHLNDNHRIKDKIITPLEFKTGRPYVTHDGQVLLYLLLLSDCYNQDSEKGLLWYLSQPNMKYVRYNHQHISYLIHLRNTIAVYLKQHPFIIPPMKMDAHVCSSCFKRTTCAILHKGIDGGNLETSGMLDKWPEEAEKMKRASIIFLNKWLKFLDIEEFEEKKSQNEIEWSREGKEREKGGYCISELRVMSIDKRTKEMTFEKINNNDIDNVNFTKGEYVVLSTENRAGVFKGTIMHITKKALKVVVMDNLLDNMKMEEEVWEVDRMCRSALTPFLRGNIIKLIKGNTGTSEQLKNLIIDKKIKITHKIECKNEQQLDGICKECSKELDADQEKVLKKIMQRELCTLINGVPGSGKSTTIAYVLKALIKMGCHVLISSFTNKALDSILKKAKDVGIKFLRIGHKYKVDPSIIPYTIGGEHYPSINTNDLKKITNEIQVYGCTCHSCDHMLINDKIFDVCILDEACQTSLPISLGPLLKCRSFVLVGDPMQLNPPIISQEYNEEEFSKSLFEILSKEYPNDVIMMRYQYRMNDNIMKLANSLVYNNEIVQGLKEIVTLSLDRSKIPLNLNKVLDKDVLFMDTDCYGKDLENFCTKYQGYINDIESEVVQSLISTFLNALNEENISIGIISPYNAQVNFLQRKIITHSNCVTISTVDSFQGSDRDIIIISFTRSNTYKECGKLINDWRRINVGMTRAKKKLIMIGSVSTLILCDFMKSIINICKENNWFLNEAIIKILK